MDELWINLQNFETQVKQNSSNSSKPLSSDCPADRSQSKKTGIWVTPEWHILRSHAPALECIRYTCKPGMDSHGRPWEPEKGEVRVKALTRIEK